MRRRNNRDEFEISKFETLLFYFCLTAGLATIIFTVNYLREHPSGGLGEIGNILFGLLMIAVLFFLMIKRQSFREIIYTLLTTPDD